jgi:hypothetical protein
MTNPVDFSAGRHGCRFAPHLQEVWFAIVSGFGTPDKAMR